MALSQFGRKMFSYKGLTLLTAPAAVLVAAGVVMGSSAGLTAHTDNKGSTWNTDAYSINVQNDTVQALFTADKIRDGYSETHCITLKNTSEIPATFTTYGTDTNTSALTDAMQVKIVTGSGGTEDGGTGGTDHCAGFVADANPAPFEGSMSDYAASNARFGSDVVPVNGDIQYQVTVSLPNGSDAEGVLANQAAALTLNWEVAK
jgi:hypothetical protein